MITSILAPSKPASHSAHHNSHFNKQNNYTCASGAQQGSGLRGEHKERLNDKWDNQGQIEIIAAVVHNGCYPS